MFSIVKCNLGGPHIEIANLMAGYHVSPNFSLDGEDLQIASACFEGKVRTVDGCPTCHSTIFGSRLKRKMSKVPCFSDLGYMG